MTDGRDTAAPVPAIELVRATKRYGSVVALDAVSMRIEQGEFFCLLGPSGCGKTTTLNLIGGFIPLSEGELRIEGQVVNDLPPHRRNVNTVFQSYALFPHMSVAQNVEFGLRMERLAAAERRERVDRYLSLVGLGGMQDRAPGQLSGGQQQRVALARALAKQPAVLLLDEPLGALDLKLRRQMQVELARIHRQVGTTFVFVTHDQEEALSMATRIAVMSGGRVVQAGTPREIYFRPVDRFVADFIGESNFLDGTVERDGDRLSLRLRSGDTVPAPPGSPPGPGTLMLRPEVLVAVHPDSTAPPPLLLGRVIGVSFLGNHTLITLETTAGALVVHRAHQGGATDDGWSPGIGEEAGVWWASEQATVLGPHSGGAN